MVNLYDTVLAEVREMRKWKQALGQPIEESAVPDMAAQISMIIISDWYNRKREGARTINARVTEMVPPDNSEYDNILKTHQRQSHSLRENYMRTLKDHGISEDDELNNFSMPSKNRGIPLSDSNFQTIQNFLDEDMGPLLSDMVNRRLMDVKKVCVDDFIKRFEGYERGIEKKKEALADNEDNEFLAQSIDFYNLQRTTHVDLIAQIATYMDIHKLKSYEFTQERAKRFYGTLFDPAVGIGPLEANQVLFYERYIPTLFLPDEEFEYKSTRYVNYRDFQARVKNMILTSGIQNQLDVSYAADFIRTKYNVLEKRTKTDFGTIQKARKNRIRLARKVMKELWGPKMEE